MIEFTAEGVFFCGVFLGLAVLAFVFGAAAGFLAVVDLVAEVFFAAGAFCKSYEQILLIMSGHRPTYLGCGGLLRGGRLLCGCGAGLRLGDFGDCDDGNDGCRGTSSALLCKLDCAGWALWLHKVAGLDTSSNGVVDVRA